MTRHRYFFEDANDNEPGFVSARPIANYVHIYCEECELPMDVCACDDAMGYDDEFTDEDDEAQWLALRDAFCLEDHHNDFTATIYREPFAAFPWLFALFGFACIAAVAVAQLTGWHP